MYSKRYYFIYIVLDDDYSNQKFSNMSDTIIQQTINNMILNRPYSLDNFKSLDNKTRLLDAAVNTWNGDAILSVIFVFMLLTMFSLNWECILYSAQVFKNHLKSFLIIK